MNQQFFSDKNKGAVWKIMSDNNAFAGIPANLSQTVKNDFDKTFESIGAHPQTDDTLVSLNKRVLTEFMGVLNKYAQQTHTQSQAQPSQVPPSQAQPSQVQQTYNPAEVSQQRQALFQNGLQAKQTEFDDLIKTPAPKKIEFADKMDVPIGAEMDKLLAETIALREKQLLEPPLTKKWFNADNIKIGESIVLNSREINKPMALAQTAPPAAAAQVIKKVAFEEIKNDIPPSDVFLSLLKKKQPEAEAEPAARPVLSENILSENIPSESILELLREILDKQNQILNKIKN